MSSQSEFNLRITDMGYSELNLSHNALYFPLNNGVTSCPYRIAHFLHIVGGENLVAPLKFFSDHIICESGQTRIPYAIGPRIKNWVGANEIIRAQAENFQNQQEEEAFPSDMKSKFNAPENTKPHGVDQLYEVFWDVVNEVKESTIICRDPELDLTNPDILVPDLISISFARKGENVIILTTFGSAESDEILNDMWTILHLKTMFAHWWKQHNNVENVQLMVKVINSDKEISVPCIEDNNEEHYKCNATDYWAQIRTLRQFLTHTYAFFGKESFQSNQIDHRRLVDTLHRNFIGKKKEQFGDYEPITIPFIRDMAKVLIIGAFVRNDVNKKFENIDIVSDLIKEMVTPLRKEIEDYVSGNQYKYANTTL